MPDDELESLVMAAKTVDRAASRRALEALLTRVYPRLLGYAAVRRALAAAGRQAVAQSNWREGLGFVLMAGAMLGAQALLLKMLEPGGFVAFQVALNWLAPFLFYIIFRLDDRVTDKRAGET